MTIPYSSLHILSPRFTGGEIFDIENRTELHKRLYSTSSFDVLRNKQVRKRKSTSGAPINGFLQNTIKTLLDYPEYLRIARNAF